MKKIRKNNRKIRINKDYDIPKVHNLFVKEVCMAKKGQITIPKAIRDKDGLKENDVFTLTHSYDGTIIFKIKKQKAPEDLMFAAIRQAPKFDWRKAWQEIRKERNRDR